MSPYEKFVALCNAVRKVASKRPRDEAIDSYLAKVVENAAAIADDEVRALLAKGHDEDAIFELTLASALDAALLRFDAGLRALAEAEKALASS
jgi:hypothetical protein